MSELILSFSISAAVFSEALGVYHAYGLVKEDLETINELGVWNEKGDLWGRVKPSVKASLTRALTKDKHKKHFSTEADVQIGKKTKSKSKAAAKPKSKAVTKSKSKTAIKQTSDEESHESEQDSDDEVEAQAEILSAY